MVCAIRDIGAATIGRSALHVPTRRHPSPSSDADPYSGLIFANVMTSPHFLVSAATNLPKSADEPGRGTPPRSVILALNVASANPALISRLSRSTISTGVFFGAPIPTHWPASKPGTN